MIHNNPLLSYHAYVKSEQRLSPLFSRFDTINANFMVVKEKRPFIFSRNVLEYGYKYD